jgi:ATP-dependent protease Clp ATPase subunit
VNDWICCFCGYKGTGNRGVVAGPKVFICRSCVEQCSPVANQRALAVPEAAAAWQVAAGAERCSFCNQTRTDGRTMVERNKFRICSKCIGICESIFAEQRVQK